MTSNSIATALSSPSDASPAALLALLTAIREAAALEDLCAAALGPAAGPAATSPAAIRLCAEVLVLKKLAVVIAVAGAAGPLCVLG